MIMQVGLCWLAPQTPVPIKASARQNEPIEREIKRSKRDGKVAGEMRQASHVQCDRRGASELDCKLFIGRASSPVWDLLKDIDFPVN